MLEFSSSTATLRFRGKFKAPYWMGSMFRGAFGWNLRRISCNTFNDDCELCNLKEDCAFYYVIFRSKAKKGHAPPPKPIIIIPPFFGKEMIFHDSPFLNVKLLFFGNYNRFLPHTILALNLIGREGIGSPLATRQRLQYLPLSHKTEFSNRFIVEEVKCNLTNKTIYDGKYINLTDLKIVDFSSLSPIKLNTDNTITIGFQTPLITNHFPLALSELVEKVRHRFIFLVNEYGTGEKIEEFKLKSKVVNYSKHFHRLYRKSSRSTKDRFFGFTGKITYKVSEIDRTALWLLKIGTQIGAGKDLSFGFGMFDIDASNLENRKES
ncbi:MAG: CRISPR system precrRNA processing endoribonuclease RAMP protein Cas6 [Candidatus Helarchaeota archaeon]